MARSAHLTFDEDCPRYVVKMATGADWAVDFDYYQRKEIIRVLVGADAHGIVSAPPHGSNAPPEFEERWTGGYIFENEWQSFRTTRMLQHP